MEGGVTLGGALAYYSTDENFNQNSGEGNNQTFAMAAYGSYAQGPWNIDGVATWSYDTYDYDRNTPTGVTQGETTGSSMSFALRGAYSFDLGGGYLGPFAGLRYMHTNVDAYEEDGTTGFELSVDSQEMDSLRADFGVRGGTTLEAGFGTVYAQGALGYSHELLDQEYSFNSFFISTPATVATNNVHNVDGGAVTLSMGASTFVDGYTELYVGYEGFYGFDDDTQHSGVMRVTMQF